jgi:Spy/CpxP family protein refolding chaperone
MKLTRIFIPIFAASLCLFASAQTATSAPKPTPPPALTQVETLQIQNIQLRYQLLQEQEQQLRSQYAALAAQIAKENPGYVLDPKTNQLVKAQTPTPVPTLGKK